MLLQEHKKQAHRGPAAAPCWRGWSPKRDLSSHCAHMRPIKRQRLAKATQLLEPRRPHCRAKATASGSCPRPWPRRGVRTGESRGEHLKVGKGGAQALLWTLLLVQGPGLGWSVAASGDSQRGGAKRGRRHPSVVSLLMFLFWECLH